jgi:hypothetical protein
VLGLLDDVALVAWFSTTLKGEMDKFHEWELTRPVVAASEPAPTKASEETAPAETPVAYPSKSHEPADATVHIAAESAKHAGTDNVAATTTDSSRENATTATDTGGNIR